MDLDHVQAFLVLCEELHFGHTAERLYRSQPRVSRLIAAFEAEIGATLFERTNRKVALTPLGAELEARLRPAYVEMLAARDAARRRASEIEQTIRVTFTTTTEGPVLVQLVNELSRQHPGWRISLTEVSPEHPYDALRSGEADLLWNWLTVDDEADLTTSSPLEHQERMLAVSGRDPLARLDAVVTEQFADRGVPLLLGVPAGVLDAFYPPPILAEMVRRTTAEGPDSPYRVHGMTEARTLVARGLAVHATVTSMALGYNARDDVVLVPITDLPPLPLGLIWKKERENVRIRAFVAVAESLAAPGLPAI